ncbi:right-handed parallel beta-helix repeat-containing protein [[Eubacterium] cellulosolvens]
MSKFKLIGRILIVLCLLLVNFFPILGPSSFGEIGAPAPNVTNVKWIVEANDNVYYNNTHLWTKDIQVNMSGNMTWNWAIADIDGNITVQRDGNFTLNNCLVNLSGNFTIEGNVYFNNVTLIMNSTFDGEYFINVASSGNFYILNTSNITAYNKNAPIDLFTGNPGNESWGLHYNFTVHGNITINNSHLSYIYGNPSYWGGVHLYETAQAVITNSTIYENEICCIYAEGNITPVIKYNHLYNATSSGIIFNNKVNGIIENNTIETYPTNWGMGIFCLNHCNPMIKGNTIKNNKYDGIYLVYFCNATIESNKILNNYRHGINFTSTTIVSAAGALLEYSYCHPRIYNNTIVNNTEYGIRDLASPAEIINNTISHSQNRSGIWVRGWIISNNWIVYFRCFGNVTNNTIQYNNRHGINFTHNYYASPRSIIMKIDNNTISNNNWSGINVEGGVFRGTQYSPQPTIILNNISNNNHSGIYNNRAVTYLISKNTIERNNESGIYCEDSSSPRIYFNHNISWNGRFGIEAKSTSRPRIYYCNITHNNDSGIYTGSGYNNQIDNNIIDHNMGYGVESYGSTPNIHHNQITNNNYSGVYLQGAGSSARVRTNDLTYNSYCGIEANNSDCQVQENNITNNSQDGIKFTGGSPSINSDNLVNYNAWNGLACYNGASPFITRSEFENNGKSGIVFDSAVPRISGIAQKNSIKNNALYGIMARNGSTGRVMGDIMWNTLDGVYATGAGTRTEVVNSEISNNGQNGVNATANSAPVVSNSTISNNAEAFWLDGSADVVAVNDSFNDAEVWYQDTAATLTVKWHVFVITRSKATGAPVSDCKVWINSTTQSQVAWYGLTDNSGTAEWLKITEYVEKDTTGNHRATEGGERTMWTPHDVSGDRREFRKTHVSPTPTIDHSQTVLLELEPNRPPTGVTGIKPSSTHNAHPTITWGPSSDPDGHTFDYELWVGTTINNSNIHESGPLSTMSYALPFDLEYNDDGNKTYHITVVTTDDHGGQIFMPRVLYLLNSKPTTPTIELTYSTKPSVELEWVRCEITGESSDPDGDEVNYTYRWYKNDYLQELLTESEVESLSDTISVTTDDIDFNKGDVWQVEVRAEDGLLDTGTGGKSLWASIEFIIGNLAPRVVEKIPDLSVDEDEELTAAIELEKMFMDPDQDVDKLTYIVTPSDEKNLTATVNQQTHKVSFKPAENYNGRIKVNITCMDEEGLWVTQWMNVTVKPVNDEPKIVRIGGKDVLTSIVEFLDDDAAMEKEWFNITVMASDIDVERGENDEVSFNLIDDYEKVQLTQEPPLQAVLSFFPTNDEVGSYEFMVSVKDKTMKSYKQKIVIRIEVKNANDKPSLLSIQKLPTGKTFQIPANRVLDLSRELDLLETDELKLLVTATDPDIDEELTFHTDSVYIVEVDPVTGNPYSANIIITPDEKSIGELVFNITVKDRKLEQDKVQIILEVQNVNDRPTVKIISPSEFEREDAFKPGTKIKFEGQAEDKDIPYGDKLFYKWTSDRDGDLSNNLSFEVSDLTIGEHIITFTAEDTEGESASTLISIQIGGLDKDNDNLPDTWESLYFNSVTKYNGQDDPDKDGYTNSEEYLGESNPMDKDDPEKQKEKEETDYTFIGAISAMVIIIIIALVFLLLFLKKSKKKKAAAEEERPLEIEQQKTKEDLYKELYGDKGEEGKPGEPSEPGKPELGADAGGARVPAPGPSHVPSGITTCPKCNTVMTFSPAGGMFCIRCGYRPEAKK